MALFWFFFLLCFCTVFFVPLRLIILKPDSWKWVGPFLSFWGKCVSHSVVSNSATPWTIGFYSRLLCPWNSPDKNTGVGCHALFQGIFPTQGSNLGLLHCRQILYRLSHQGSLYLLVNVLNDCFFKALFWNSIRFTWKLPEQYWKCSPPPNSSHDDIRGHTRKLTQGNTSSYTPDLAGVLPQGQSTSL